MTVFEKTLDETEMIDKRKRGVCYYNDVVDCDSRKCASCGWHPVVSENRKKAFREKIRDEARYKLKFGGHK